MRFFKAIICVFAVAIAAALSVHPVHAMDRSELLDQYIDESTSSYQSMMDKQEFLFLSQPAWQDVEQSEYLFYAFWTVYNGVLAYKLDNDRLPTDLHEVVSGGYAPGWPVNPYDNWEPMRVVDSAAEFAPGCLVWQVCPPEEYSYIGAIAERNLIPLSFELGIYGPDLEFARLGAPEVMQFNNWAVVAKGTLYQAGSHRQTRNRPLTRIHRLAYFQIQ